jgi:hypothetical protein
MLCHLASTKRELSHTPWFNLASTFVLKRISVVLHAALMCIRRIFANIVPPIASSIPITFLGALGILVSVPGFWPLLTTKGSDSNSPNPLVHCCP